MRRQRDFKLHFPPQDAGLTDVAPFWEKQLDQKKKKRKKNFSNTSTRVCQNRPRETQELAFRHMEILHGRFRTVETNG